MFKELDWAWAARRAGVVVVIYLVLMYVLSNVAPGSFDLTGQWPAFLVNAVVFFFVFTLIYAVIERSRRRRVASQSGKTGGTKDKDDEERESGPLKGRVNPNTSRKKATRRRR